MHYIHKHSYYTPLENITQVQIVIMDIFLSENHFSLAYYAFMLYI